MACTRTEAERPGSGSALTPTRLAKLQAWFSPSFPIGSFGYSHGLEWVVEAQEVRDAGSLAEWVAGTLRHGAGRSDAILLAELWRAVHEQDWELADEISVLAAALQPTYERRLESLNQGRAFLAAVAAGWPAAAIDTFQARCGGEQSYAVAAGVATAAHEVPLDSALVASLHAFAANLVSAGVRLVPLGQTDGVRIMAALEPLIAEIAQEAQSSSLDDLGSATFLADIASMNHETQYTRLFRS
ncbi:urease accessory protein UreF [Ramlibacter tataouinensis]|uniref:urease accessory protein UreF n=1 Tax=Ramlibacter tataouinensis TaxID=94132 RepID=UPI0022F3AC52|nr:urease accessory protein UreF [Ramlibacter tataouinensis]WBY00569.1 urease accessory protein UreF [Ramlibacter tataouinensis]